jgi:hypothetical protein
LNKSARQLLAKLQLARREDLAVLGPELAAAVELPPGTRKITRLLIDGIPHRAIFASALVARLDRGVTILSILPCKASSERWRSRRRLTWSASSLTRS